MPSTTPAPRRRGRPPGMTTSRLMKRIVIAAAVLQKIKIAQVARDLGVSRSWASREAHDPETQGLISAVEKQDPESAICSLRRALKAIADKMIPLNNVYIRAGKIILAPNNAAAWGEFVRMRRLLQKYY